MNRIAVFALALAMGLGFWDMDSSAMAGSLSATDGAGTWKSTRCPPPQAQPLPAKDPEIPADDLNSLWVRHNQFVAETQNYMDCVSREATADADAVGPVITSGAQAAMAEAQAKVDASAARLQGRKRGSWF